MSTFDRLLLHAGFSGGPPAPAGPVVIGWNCGALVRPFLVTGEVRHGTLHLLGNQPVTFGGASGVGGPLPAALGSFAINIDRWPGCPHCRTKHNRSGEPVGFWRCGACGGFNCPGDRNGFYTCSCGNVATRGSFVTMHTFEVRGTPAASTPRAVAAAPPPVAGVIAPPPLRTPAPARVSSLPQLSAPPGPPPLRLPGRR
jgi:hypothetical protein